MAQGNRLLGGLLLAGSLVASLAAGANAQTVTADFSKAPGNGTYTFQSSTPATFPDLIRAADAPKANIVGHLFLPKAEGKVPAVVIIHGSGGIYQAMLDYWPKLFNAAGIAVFSVDSFGPRGVKSTADDQSQVPFAADVADAFAALKILSSHPKVEAGKIAVMGFSRGGITAWRTGINRVIQAQGGAHFAAHIPVYSGGCVGDFRLRVSAGVFAKEPMFWVHGDADDYAVMEPCRDYAEAIAKAGTPADFMVIAGARHKFDSDDTRRVTIAGAQKTLASCPIEVDIQTFASYDRFSGERLTGEPYQAAQRDKCRAKGASVEGNKAARDKAGQGILGFLRKVFELKG